MKITLSIPGTPMPKQSVRSRIVTTHSGRQFVHHYQPKEVVQNESNIRAVVINQLPLNFIPLTGPVYIERLLFVFPPLKTMKKKELAFIAEGNMIPKTTKPDLTDNLQKSLWDALQGVVFVNDAQICKMNNVGKFYGNKPGITLELEEITLAESCINQPKRTEMGQGAIFSSPDNQNIGFFN